MTDDPRPDGRSAGSSGGPDRYRHVRTVARTPATPSSETPPGNGRGKRTFNEAAHTELSTVEL